MAAAADDAAAGRSGAGTSLVDSLGAMLAATAGAHDALLTTLLVLLLSVGASREAPSSPGRRR